MINRRLARIALIVLGSGVLINLLVGIGAALQENWMKMSLFFFVSALVVFFLMFCLLAMKVDACFSRLDNLFSEKSDSTQPRENGMIDKKATTNLKPIYRNNIIIEKVIYFLDVLFVAVSMSLGVIAGLYQDLFRMGLYLTACAFTVIIFNVVEIVLKINKCSMRLENLISDIGKKQSPPICPSG